MEIDNFYDEMPNWNHFYCVILLSFVCKFDFRYLLYSKNPLEQEIMPLTETQVTPMGFIDFNRRVQYNISYGQKSVKYGFPTLNISLPALPVGWLWRDDLLERIVRRAVIETRGMRCAQIFGPVNHILARQYQSEHLKDEPMWQYHLQDRQSKIEISQRPNLVKLSLMFPNSYAEPKSGSKIPSDTWTSTDNSESISIEFGALQDLVRKTSYEKANYSDLAGIGLGYTPLEFLVDTNQSNQKDPFACVNIPKGSVEYTGTECIYTTNSKLRLNFMGNNSISGYILLRIVNEDKYDPKPMIEELRLQVRGQTKVTLSGNYSSSSQLWKRHVGSVRPSPEWYLIPCANLREFCKEGCLTLHMRLKNDGDKNIDRIVDIYIH